MSEEFEVTLRACTKDPDSLFREVSALRSLGPFALTRGRTSLVQDRYYDTREGALMKRGFALRLRVEGGRVLLCLKGRERIDERGAVSRLEIEGPWSEELLVLAVDTAEVIPRRDRPFRPEDPQATLESLGLRVIQSRGMVRSRLTIHPASGPGDRAVGEVSLDKVRYQAAGLVLVHYEIEIEAASKDRQDAVRTFAGLLHETFAGRLCRWDHNKLATGLALEGLIRERRIPPPPEKDTSVSEEWYGKIEEWIGEHRAAPGGPAGAQG